MTTVVTKHDLLERKANIIRSRLMRTLDALDTRRHHATDVGHHVTETAKQLAIPVGAVLGATLTLASGIAIVLHRRAERRQRHTFGYWFGRAFRPPPPPQPSFALTALRKVALSVLVAVATEVAKRRAAAMVDGHTRAALGVGSIVVK